MKYIEEYDMNEKIELSDRLTIRFTPSGHIISAAQVELWISNEIKNKVYQCLSIHDIMQVLGTYKEEIENAKNTRD